MDEVKVQEEPVKPRSTFQIIASATYYYLIGAILIAGVYPAFLLMFKPGAVTKVDLTILWLNLLVVCTMNGFTFFKMGYEYLKQISGDDMNGKH